VDNLASSNSNSFSSENQDSALELIAQQIKLLGRQIELMQDNSSISLKMKETDIQGTNSNSSLEFRANELTKEEKKEHSKPFGASPRIEKYNSNLTKQQEFFLNELISNYTKKTAKSKAYTQKYRSTMADPRVVSGFKPATKELVYPLVVEKSSGY